MDAINFNVISTLSELGNKLQKSQLLKNKLKNTKPLTDSLCDYLKVTEDECYIFVVIFIVQIQKGIISIREFNSFLDLNSIQAISFKKVFDSLYQKRLILANSLDLYKSTHFFGGKGGYRVNPKIMESIFENMPIGDILNEKVDIYDFVRKVSRLINERDEDEFNSLDLFTAVSKFEERNNHLDIIKRLVELNLNIEDRTLLYEIVDDFINVGFTYFHITIKNMYDSVRIRMLKSRQILDGSNILLTKKLITLGDANMVDDLKVELSESAVEMFFQQDTDIFLTNKLSKNLISHEKIELKQLYFNTKLQTQINELTSSLMPDNFFKLQNRMLDNHMTKGVAAVFYGGPGTGKSETAFQIAKATGRSVIHVDLSETKSMWFGESEKKVKEIFTEYAKACKPGIPCPILLFNEADGVLSRRKSNTVATTDQTLNTMQNILLEQFEKNEGVIIATTNLITNFDPAFERRFLFKVQFDKPDVDVIKQIWKNKLDWLDSSTIDYLATQYIFTGGEIDNIVRKAIMNEVINGDKPTPEKIIDFCNLEKLSKTTGRKLGYQ